VPSETRIRPLAPIVVDASALVEVLINGRRAADVRGAVSSNHIVIPDLVNVEVLSTLRRLERTGWISASLAAQAIDDLWIAPFRRWRSAELVYAIWGMRANLTAYDACYVALARLLQCPVVTADSRLARAPDLGIPVILV
jgi:predicted nucleic acid-binding protein